MPTVPKLFHNQCHSAAAPLQSYPPIDRRAQLKAQLKEKQEEQSEMQRAILADMANLLIAEDGEELNRRYAQSEALDDEIDQLLSEYKAECRRQGVAPTPRPQMQPVQPIPQRTPQSAPVSPQAQTKKVVITRPPGAVKGGGIKKTPRNAYAEVLASMTQWTPLQPPKPTQAPKQMLVEAEKTAVHVNPLATSVQAMAVGVMNI